MTSAMLQRSISCRDYYYYLLLWSPAFCKVTALARRGFITKDTSVCRLICVAIWRRYSATNKGEVWALQRTKKPEGLRLSVLMIKLKNTPKKTVNNMNNSLKGAENEEQTEWVILRIWLSSWSWISTIQTCYCLIQHKWAIWNGKENMGEIEHVNMAKEKERGSLHYIICLTINMLKFATWCDNSIHYNYTSTSIATLDNYCNFWQFM